MLRGARMAYLWVMADPQRLYLHVGLQKTGTSYLQGVLRANADELAAQGLDLVPRDLDETFAVMLVVRERLSPSHPPRAAGALERWTRSLAGAPGDRALLSQESLAATSEAQARRLLAAAGDREVHVVVTVRDLARALPSSWQQELKAGRSTTYGHYLHRLQQAQRRGATGHPWIHLDAAAVVARWSSLLPADRVHVVTVPPPGSAPTLLLERFCRVLGVDASRLVPQESAGNTSLGRAQAELLRRVNEVLPEEVHRRRVYGAVGKRFLAAQVLGPQTGTSIRVPAGLREWCEEVAAAQAASLGTAGCRIEGTLEDLRCREEAFEPPGPDATADPAEPTETEVSEAAVLALAEVLRRRAADGRRPRAPAGGGTSGRRRRLPRLRRRST